MSSPNLFPAFASRTQPQAAPEPASRTDPKVAARREKLLKILGGPAAESYKTAFEAGKQYAAGDKNAPISLANLLSGLPTVSPRYRSNNG